MQDVSFILIKNSICNIESYNHSFTIQNLESLVNLEIYIINSIFNVKDFNLKQTIYPDYYYRFII
jgi:hypothetical protein